MPRILDNVQDTLLSALEEVLIDAYRADFCVGYFHLRGWGRLAEYIDLFTGKNGSCCRVLVGMQKPPEAQMREMQSAWRAEKNVDSREVARLYGEIVNNFKEQIEFGVPTSSAEANLRKLARQIREGKVRVKLFLRYPLHAKLYLVYRSDRVTPIIGFVGSSNLTFAGLSEQGELNVDVVEQDAARKLSEWFETRWNDEYSLDISEQLAQLIETSWAREELLSPYLVYLKMAYHLSEDARLGARQFKLPKDLQSDLLDFQAAAVQLCARILYKRGGVLLGDVVGLGKTLMATAVAKIFQEDDGSNTLIICPPKLQQIWDRHASEYGLAARVLSLGRVIEELPHMPRFRTVIIDESHNLRNREGKRYRIIRNYIEVNEPRVVLLTATPYNKHFNDISNQVRLFVDEEQDIGIRPERFFQWWSAQGFNEADFIRRYQTSPRSLRAFEQSAYTEDWRDLMRLFMVRRTRQFILRNYAHYDAEKGRYYVMMNNKRQYFPIRVPHTLSFPMSKQDATDQYARLFAEPVVGVIESLALPRYGLALYLVPDAERMANAAEKQLLENLNRAGKRLIGFCRTNLFKRLESCGYSFLFSIKRHILRNMVTLYALEQEKPIPVGTQDASLLDTALNDIEDDDLADDELTNDPIPEVTPEDADDLQSYRQRAAIAYSAYEQQYATRFKWIPPKFFHKEQLKQDLQADAEKLLNILHMAGRWCAQNDQKLRQLVHLVYHKHREEKVLIFTQFAHTALYLEQHLTAQGMTDVQAVTSQTPDPVEVARRFSPRSNGGLREGETELRVLIATDVLAEGQNLQDCHIVVNYDLPWAIIRLIQRAGRVDRIGQQHENILVYSFMPADGVETIIRLRKRLIQRLKQNQEVVGTDEVFLGEEAQDKLRDLYTEKAGVLDDDSDDQDVDLTSIALEVWNSAPVQLQEQAKNLPPVVYATRPAQADGDAPGVISYLRFHRDNEDIDVLVRLDEKGNVLSQSLATIFQAAACSPETPAITPLKNHHELVAKSVENALQEVQTLGGQLGTLRSIRRKLYERLKSYRERMRQQPTLFNQEEIAHLDTLLEQIYRYPLRESARDVVSRQMKLGIPDHELLRLAWQLHQDDRLCQVIRTEQPMEPQILCSLGIRWR